MGLNSGSYFNRTNTSNDEFWNYVHLKPEYVDYHPSGQPALSGIGLFPGWEKYFTFDDLPEVLQNTGINIFIIGVDGSLWDLVSGDEGVLLLDCLDGLLYPRPEVKYSQGAYQIGADLERVEWGKQEINFRVGINPTIPGRNNTVSHPTFRLDSVFKQWRHAWSETEECYLGVFTRTSGFRFLKVRLTEMKPDTSFDPNKYGNGFLPIAMTITAAYPFFTTWEHTETWTNHDYGFHLDDFLTVTGDEFSKLLAHPDFRLETFEYNLRQSFQAFTFGKHSFTMRNEGDGDAWPKYVVSAPGIVRIQDGIGGPMIEMPLTYPWEGQYLVDTDPTARTLTSQYDPVDTIVYQTIRNSHLLDFFLSDIGNIGVPLWQRADNVHFNNPIPPGVTGAINAWHSEPGGIVLAITPQHYKAAIG